MVDGGAGFCYAERMEGTYPFWASLLLLIAIGIGPLILCYIYGRSQKIALFMIGIGVGGVLAVFLVSLLR